MISGSILCSDLYVGYVNLDSKDCVHALIVIIATDEAEEITFKRLFLVTYFGLY